MLPQLNSLDGERLKAGGGGAAMFEGAGETHACANGRVAHTHVLQANAVM